MNITISYANDGHEEIVNSINEVMPAIRKHYTSAKVDDGSLDLTDDSFTTAGDGTREAVIVAATADGQNYREVAFVRIDEDSMNAIESWHSYPASVRIVAADGVHEIPVERNSCDGEWTDEEAENDAREIIRENGMDDSTADHTLISRIAEQFPRANS